MFDTHYRAHTRVLVIALISRTNLICERVGRPSVRVCVYASSCRRCCRLANRLGSQCVHVVRTYVFFNSCRRRFAFVPPPTNIKRNVSFKCGSAQIIDLCSFTRG